MNRDFDRTTVPRLAMAELMSLREDLASRLGRTLDEIMAVTQGLGLGAAVGPVEEETPSGRKGMPKEREPWRKKRGKGVATRRFARRRMSRNAQAKAGTEGQAEEAAPEPADMPSGGDVAPLAVAESDNGFSRTAEGEDGAEKGSPESRLEDATGEDGAVVQPGGGTYSGEGLERRIGMVLDRCEWPASAREIANSLREGDIGPSTLHGRVRRALTKMKLEGNAVSVGGGAGTKWMAPGRG